LHRSNDKGSLPAGRQGSVPINQKSLISQFIEDARKSDKIENFEIFGTGSEHPDLKGGRGHRLKRFFYRLGA